MQRKDWPAWRAKTLRLNAGKALSIGQNFQDILGNKGTIIGLTPPEVPPGTIEDHGSIQVLHENGDKESYVMVGWESFLRIL